MARVREKKVPMPQQEPHVRAKNFDEVALGYDVEMACEEASRCLQCKNQPCVSGCPVNVRIPDFIAKIRDGKYLEAYDIIRQTNSLPAICGRVCPQESQCESKCIRGIRYQPVAIGRLERFAADYAIAHNAPPAEIAPAKGIKVAVIGSGPAGLTCAGDLAKLGYSVTVFEALHTPGGVLSYGIPEFRLPKAIVAREIASLEAMGVEIRTDSVIGRMLSVDELQKMGYRAVFLGTGAGLPNFMGIPGENLNGVYSANEFLTRTNLMKAYVFPQSDTPIRAGRRVAVVGGGNVAMDAARCALRLGAEEVSVVYRRSRQEMPARHEEIEHAEEEGVRFHMLTNPVSVQGDEKGWVTGLEVVRMELGEADASGRRRPIEIAGSNTVLPIDTVIIAIGNSPNPLIHKTTPGLEADRKGCLIVDADGLTTRQGVYAGGDAVTGAATVILAMGAGKKAAEAIDKMLMEA